MAKGACELAIPFVLRYLALDIEKNPMG